jgi:hypothetical protein
MELTNWELSIKPSNKKHKKELDDYIKKLDLKTKAEIYILNCVLYMDWSRQKILQSIKFIKETDNGSSVLFNITMRAPCITTDYSTSNPYKEKGWKLDTLDERLRYVYHQMDYYTKK